MLLLSCIFDAVIGRRKAEFIPSHRPECDHQRLWRHRAILTQPIKSNSIKSSQISTNFNPENGVFAIVVFIPPQMALANFERSMQLINTNKMQSDESAKSKAIESHSCHDDDDDR